MLQKKKKKVRINLSISFFIYKIDKFETFYKNFWSKSSILKNFCTTYSPGFSLNSSQIGIVVSNFFWENQFYFQLNRRAFSFWKHLQAWYKSTSSSTKNFDSSQNWNSMIPSKISLKNPKKILRRINIILIYEMLTIKLKENFEHFCAIFFLSSSKKS